MNGRNMSNASFVSRVTSSTLSTVAFARSTMCVSLPPPQRGRTRSSNPPALFAAALTIGVDIASKRAGVIGLFSIRPSSSFQSQKPDSLS
jgi:hypothetical protein